MKRTTILFFIGLSLSMTVAIACGDDDASNTNDANNASGADGGASSSSSSSSSGTPGTATKNPPVSREEFVAGIPSAMCDGIEKCCANAGYDFVAGACEASILGADGGATSGANNGFTGAARIEDPSLTYDPQAGGDCLAALRTYNSVCKAASSADPTVTAMAEADVDVLGTLACARMLSGTKQPGEPCQVGDCALPPNKQAYVMCSPPNNGDSDVDAGSVPVCRVVQYHNDVGASCYALDKTPPTDIVLNTCGLLPEDGVPAPPAPTTLQEIVDQSLVCDPATTTCQKGANVFSKEGQSCAVTGYCNLGLYCDKTTTNTCKRGAALNASCAVDRCGAGAQCNASTKICDPQKADGESCEGSSDCLGRCNDKGQCAPTGRGFSSKLRCTGKP